MTETQIQEKIEVHIIGTSHIASESVEKIQTVSQTVNTDLICVELDRQRLSGLLHPDTKKPSFFTMLRQVGAFGALFVYFGGKIQSYLGKKYGLKPGSDMLSAIEYAKTHSIKAALIDQPIHITLSRLSKKMTFFEYGRMFWETSMSFLFPKKTAKKYHLHELQLSSVPSTKVIQKLLKLVEEKYPTIYTCLIEERNIYMSQRIIRLVQSQNFRRIVVVVGAGHVPGMKKILDKKEVVSIPYEIIYHEN
ncbi:MAG: TraB/GumN family protein [Candidatus Woesearchaeota archaeon]